MRTAILGLTLACAACGGSTAPSTTPQLQVGGTYAVRKTTVSDTCGVSVPGAVVVNPAEVRHSTGASSFVLVDHGTRELPGTVNRDGSFVLSPDQSLVQNTIAATDTFADGRFSATGFQLRDTTDLAASPVSGGPPCRLVADWVATKDGAPNVIP